MKKNDSILLGHILDAATEVAERVKEVKREDFDKDEVLLDANTNRIRAIGEVASKISHEFRQQNEQIPWPPIVGMQRRPCHNRC